VAGRKVHTIEDAAISWLHPATEGLYFTLLEEGIVRIGGSRVRLWQVANQIVLCWLVSFFDSILVSHHGDVRIPVKLWKT